MPSFSLRRPEAPRRGTHGFTLVEVLVTLAVVLIILIGMLQFVGTVQQAWKSAAADPFADAENTFDAVCQNLAGATLEPYQDYADTSGSFRTNSTSAFTPDHLTRRSDLDFVTGPSSGTNGLLVSSGRTTVTDSAFFVAPQGYTQTDAHTGMARLLNTIGYFVEFGDDTSAPSFLLPAAHRWRWRLKQVRQPSESLQIFSLAASADWIQQATQTTATTPIFAENIVAFLVLPERSASDNGPALSPDFRYDSRNTGNPLTRHQLPSRLRLALVAIDETSARMLAARNGSSPPALVPPGLFQQAAQLDADLASLDGTLTASKIGHRIFQRKILLTSAAWSETASE